MKTLYNSYISAYLDINSDHESRQWFMILVSTFGNFVAILCKDFDFVIYLHLHVLYLQAK